MNIYVGEPRRVSSASWLGPGLFGLLFSACTLWNSVSVSCSLHTHHGIAFRFLVLCIHIMESGFFRSKHMNNQQTGRSRGKISVSINCPVSIDDSVCLLHGILFLGFCSLTSNFDGELTPETGHRKIGIRVNRSAIISLSPESYTVRCTPFSWVPTIRHFGNFCDRHNLDFGVFVGSDHPKCFQNCSIGFLLRFPRIRRIHPVSKFVEYVAVSLCPPRRVPSPTAHGQQGRVVASDAPFDQIPALQ
jgi:hypothetical protein